MDISLKKMYQWPISTYKDVQYQLDTMAHTCNPNTLGGRDRWITWPRPAWTTWQNPISTKNTKISWAWWHIPVFPATQEAEAEESLEPRRRRLRGAEIALLHSSLGTESETLYQNNNNNNSNNNNEAPSALFLEVFRFGRFETSPQHIFYPF